MKLFLVLSLVVPLALSLECWNYIERQQGGSINQIGDKLQVNCSTSYCVTVKNEGGQDDETYFGCSNATDPKTNCKSVGTTKQSSGSIYTRITCCNTDLCNSGNIIFMPFLGFLILFFLN